MTDPTIADLLAALNAFRADVTARLNRLEQEVTTLLLAGNVASLHRQAYQLETEIRVLREQASQPPGPS